VERSEGSVNATDEQQHKSIFNPGDFVIYSGVQYERCPGHHVTEGHIGLIIGEGIDFNAENNLWVKLAGMWTVRFYGHLESINVSTGDKLRSLISPTQGVT